MGTRLFHGTCHLPSAPHAWVRKLSAYFYAAHVLKIFCRFSACIIIISECIVIIIINNNYNQFFLSVLVFAFGVLIFVNVIIMSRMEA